MNRLDPVCVVVDTLSTRPRPRSLHFTGDRCADAMRVRRELDRVELGPAYPVEIREVVVRVDSQHITITLCCLVPDRDTGEKILVNMDQGIHTSAQTWQFLDLFMRMLRFAVLHEMEEGVFVDGERPDDPHRLNGATADMVMIDGVRFE